MHSAFFQFFVCLEFFHLDHFHSIFFIVDLVDSPVHLPVGSLPDNFVQSVVLDDSNHCFESIILLSKYKTHNL